MKPPLLRVAMIWGRDSLRFQSHSELTLKTPGERQVILPPGEISFRIGSGHPAKRETWLWLGEAREDDLSQVMVQALETSGWATGLWPVGLNPNSGEWSVREYRLLARPAEGDMESEELRRWLNQTQPGMQAEVISLPLGQGSGIILVAGEDREMEITAPMILESESEITCLEAPVGEGFHWEHSEALRWASPAWVAFGVDSKLCAGVEIDVEEYLASVNSSEMPADSPLEFLKSQVVAARSWLLANWGSHHPGEPYSICNGDHCQCFYGPDRIKEASRRAVAETTGQVLMHQHKVCDARYAKACGGVTEPAANVWPFAGQPYLGHFRDLPEAPVLDLSAERVFREFQARSNPSDACCSPGYAPMPGRLKDLSDLYRWQETSSAQELAQIIRTKTRVEIGEIENLIPVRRSLSGRLIELEVVGSKSRLRLAPELAIRRALSRTHLPSSAFWIEKTGEKITLHGMGWGHGVGLCQIGAAALAIKGWDYAQILKHYYRGTNLMKVYE